MLEAIAGVEADFPIPGYVTEGTRRALLHVTRELALVAPEGTPRLLDVGCGPMDKTAVLRRLGYECWGLDDLSDPWHGGDGRMAAIEAFARSEGIHFELVLADAAPRLPEETFDLVTMFDVIEHLHESPRGILNVAGTSLRSGGLLCITMPNSVNLRKRLAVLRGRSNYPPIDQFFHSDGVWRGHVREYTLQETAFLCHAAGFAVERATTFEAIAFDKLHPALATIYSAVSAAVPGCRSGICVIARKPPTWAPVRYDPCAYRNAVATSLPPALR